MDTIIYYIKDSIIHETTRREFAEEFCKQTTTPKGVGPEVHVDTQSKDSGETNGYLVCRWHTTGSYQYVLAIFEGSDECELEDAEQKAEAYAFELRLAEALKSTEITSVYDALEEAQAELFKNIHNGLDSEDLSVSAVAKIADKQELESVGEEIREEFLEFCESCQEYVAKDTCNAFDMCAWCEELAADIAYEDYRLGKFDGDLDALYVQHGLTVYAPSDASEYRMHYSGQWHPQPAYIELSEDGDVSVSYDGEIGNAVPCTVWHGVDLRWTFDAHLSVDGVEALLAEVAPLLGRIHAGHTVEWDGSNMRGTLDYDATQASEELDRYLSHE